jgi:hypothetical protein
MKVEDLPVSLRRLLAVSDAYLCYSVTSKKNLLRLIHTSTGDKVILRGHDAAIIDIKFSPVDGGVLASIDMGELVTSPHIFFWRKSESSNIDFEVVNQLHICASFIEPHPCLPNLWLLGDGSNFGVFSTVPQNNSPPPCSYSDLLSHIQLRSGAISGNNLNGLV